MQEWRSSLNSEYLSAKLAALIADVVEALRYCSCEVKRIRTSNGSAMIAKVINITFAHVVDDALGVSFWNLGCFMTTAGLIELLSK